MTVALPDAAAKVAELDAVIAQLSAQLAELRVERARWKDLEAAVSRFNGDRVQRPGGASSKSYGRVREGLLEAIADGRPHQTSDLAAALDASESGIRKHVRQLVDEGVVQHCGRGSIQLMPPPKAPAVQPEPVALRPTRPPLVEVVPQALTQPLRGAAPKARCPVCNTFREAVGTQGGRYVFECDCPAPGSTKRSPRRFFNAVDHGDRPRGVA